MEVEKQKRGRKPLNLTDEEWKVRRELQRKARANMRKDAKRREDITRLVVEITMLELNGNTTDEIIAALMDDRNLTIKYTREEQSISGYNGERLKRKHG